ncbi:hypothetical protein J1N35_005212 [Gossypium stocksii]|uniref:Uncharacterized protein n=1 Tax=Gossypium stocksii TaxID=47602 RepID=A0A9D3WDF2_9ROSI|nr:hypothetical protein J1N35_005212 [Gossypium stocksii]
MTILDLLSHICVLRALELSMGDEGANSKMMVVVLAENEHVVSGLKFKRRRVSTVWDFLPEYERMTTSNFGLSRQIAIDQSSQGKW